MRFWNNINRISAVGYEPSLTHHYKLKQLTGWWIRQACWCSRWNEWCSWSCELEIVTRIVLPLRWRKGQEPVPLCFKKVATSLTNLHHYNWRIWGTSSSQRIQFCCKKYGRNFSLIFLKFFISKTYVSLQLSHSRHIFMSKNTILVRNECKYWRTPFVL